MATVTNAVKLPDGSTPGRVDVVIELVASATGKAAGWVTATDVTLESIVRPTVTNGAWTATLTPNADITPSGSVYKITEYVDKTRYTHYITVGSGGGSLFDLLTDAPASVASAALTSHIADTSDAHDASAISVLDTASYYSGTTVESVLAEVGQLTASLRTGNRAIVIGDSIASGGDVQVNYQVGGSWFADVCGKSHQRLRFYRNAGVGGNTSTAMLARFTADVTAYHPDIVVIGGVTPNDVGQSVPVATRKSNIQAMVAAAVADGSRVILATSTPNDTTGTRDSLVEMNHWLIGWANTQGIPVLDIYSPLADPADGTYLPSYTSDGTHPNDTGNHVIGTAVAAQLPPDLRAVPFLTAAKGDPENLIVNGVFHGDANADGLADDWSLIGALSARSLTSLSGGYGNWQSVTCDGSQAIVTQNISTGWSVGDTLAFSGRIQKDPDVVVNCQVTCSGASTQPTQPRALSAVSAELEDFTFYLEFPIPAGTTVLQSRLIVNTAAGDVRIGQWTLRNLTALGLV